MKSLKYALPIFLFFVLSCDDTKDKDLIKPVIESSEVSIPQNCDRFYRGQDIEFQYTFTDNLELGNFNIEIHNNFDHHSHSTEANPCELDPIKKAGTNAWVYNQDFSIPLKTTHYDAIVNIPIPENIEPGDYHLMIRVTDASGWQQLKALSIKVI